MSRPPIDFPVGPKPNWELEHDDDGVRENISKSYSSVIFHSLRQSRERWLSSTFPRFSTKSRNGKTIDQSPPAHTIQTRGKCDFEIGPHTFPDTVFYEVHYLPSQTLPTTPAYTYQPPSGSWQSKTPYSAYAHNPSTMATAGSPLELEKSSTPLLSSLTAVTTITPALIQQVNSAASSNPILANLLQLAAAGMATADQLKTLGLLIQSLATPEAQPVPSATTQSQSSMPSSIQTLLPPSSSIKEFDLVIEFRETPSERWIFPRGPVTCERIRDSHSLSYDIIIRARLPFDKINTPGTTPTPAPSVSLKDEFYQAVTFHLRNTPSTVWDTIARWAGSEQKMQENKAILDALTPIDRVYLGYRLPQGPLLNQLQAAVMHGYNMKTLKLGVTKAPRTKRKTTKQKVEVSGARTQVSGEEPSPGKRRRASQAERNSAAAQIQCVFCKQADVPLILGGRFCRPCVDAGHGTIVPAYVPESNASSGSPRVAGESVDNILSKTSDSTSSLK